MSRLIFTLLVILATCLSVTGQGFSYQAVVRDAQGSPLINQDVSFRFSYAPDGDTTAIAFAETFSATTNEFGLVNLVLTLGTPEQGNSGDLNFLTNRYWLRTELDIDGGSNYEVMGIAPFREVPYAQLAEANRNTVDNSSFDSRCLPPIDGLSACVWTIGGRALTLETLVLDAGRGYILTTNAPNDPIKIIIEGDSGTSNGFGELVFIIKRNSDKPVSYYQFQIADLANQQVANPFARGHVIAQELVEGDIKITIPNIAGGYPSGFRLILN